MRSVLGRIALQVVGTCSLSISLRGESRELC